MSVDDGQRQRISYRDMVGRNADNGACEALGVKA